MRISIVRGIAAAACLLFFVSGCTRLLLEKGFPQVDGEIAGLAVEKTVEVFRDAHGIAHIYAQTEEDLMFAQGFVHAQDRLWQMETFRRLAAGTLCELAGEETLELDHWMRLIGLPDMRKAMTARITELELRAADAYLKGVNAYIEKNKDNLPLEFQKLHHVPAPWTVEDLYNVMVVNSWFLQTNFPQEIVALSVREHIGTEQLKDLLPSAPGATLPEDAYYETLRKRSIGPFIKEIGSLYALTSTYEGTGSNNWVTAKGPGQKPLLSNDPHLALMLPGVWYFCHLNAPGYHAAGASMAGTPGIVIGHNDRIAWGYTNVMTDVVDLYVFQVDSVNPYVYYVDGKPYQMTRKDEVYKMPDGTEQVRRIFSTIHGPVISKVSGKYDSVVALKWYGTVPMEQIDDRSGVGMFELNRATSVREAFKAARHFKLFGQNLVVADVDGNIGWHAYGAVPLRKGYSGRLPADGSSGKMNWDGFLPYDQMPTLYNPPEGFIATANNRTVTDDSPSPITFGWCAPYRRERIAQQLAAMENPTPEAFARLHMDVHSLQADRIVPKLSEYSFKNPKARQALEKMVSWDREVAADSIGAAVWEVFVTQWLRELLEDEFGESLKFYFHILPAAYLAHDVLLDRPESALWDRIDTPGVETPRQILEGALIKTIDFLEAKLGPDPERWQWGRLHQYFFAHPGAKKPIEHKLLSRGPYPAPGDATTVNAACFDPAQDDYGAFVIPSLRMIVPMNDMTQATIVGPAGQSAQPGHPHYDDMIQPWLNGKTVPLYFSREQIEQNKVSTLLLKR